MDTIYTEESTPAIARALLESISSNPEGATVIGLSGELGAGKTTLVKSVAEVLGITETITSPTFVIAKQYGIPDKNWRTLIHIDAYRIESIDELMPIGWESMIEMPETLIIVEWPERIEEALPSDTKRFALSHQGESRHISVL